MIFSRLDGSTVIFFINFMLCNNFLILLNNNILIMRNKLFLGILFLSAMSLLISCSPKKAEPVAAVVIDKEQVKKEIQGIENKFASVYSHRNLDSLTYYADDAVSYFVGQEPISGKAAIHKFIEEDLKDFPVGAKIVNQTLEVYVTADGNNVAEVGAYQQIDSTGKILQNGHYFSFFAKRNGQYVCTRDMATSHPVENTSK
jgi:ketosteroid isomerase-like protein